MAVEDIVVHLTPIKRTTLASANIAMFISKTLGLRLVDNVKDLLSIKNPGIIILVNGPPAFCPFREELAALTHKCDTLVFVQNDYTIFPPSQVNKVMRARGWVNAKGHIDPPYIWSTVERRIRKQNDSYVNWNALSYKPSHANNVKDRIGELFYFGAYREGRDEEFEKYFTDLGMMISASKRAQIKFGEKFPAATLIDPVDDVIKACSAFDFGLYIHDKATASSFMSLANRFYEMLAARMLIFIADNAVGTFTQAGYYPDKLFVVRDSEELESRITMYQQNKRLLTSHRSMQQRMWATKAFNERKKLAAKVRKLFSNVNEELPCG